MHRKFGKWRGRQVTWAEQEKLTGKDDVWPEIRAWDGSGHSDRKGRVFARERGRQKQRMKYMVGICEKAVPLGMLENEVWWSKQGWVHAAGMGCPLSFSSLTPNCWSQALGACLGNFAVICHSVAFMTTLWSQMRGTIYHKGLFFMSYWAPGNSCMLFIPHTLFSSLFMKFPMSLTSASRHQAVLWIKCCLTKAQQLGMSLRVCIMNSNSILCFSTSFISE